MPAPRSAGGASGVRCCATAPVYADVPGRSAVEVHLLCHRGDYLCAIWALKTLYRTSGVRWPAVMHVQGACTASDASALPCVTCPMRVSSRRTRRMPVCCRHSRDRYPRLLEARRQSPFMMKLIDPVLLGRAERIVILDSDVLFFRRSTRASCACGPGARRCLAVSAGSRQHLQRDRRRGGARRSAFAFLNASTAASRSSRGRWSIWTLCERLLEHPDVRRPSGWIEQTLFAFCAGARGQCRISLAVVRDLAGAGPRLQRIHGPSLRGTKPAAAD